LEHHDYYYNTEWCSYVTDFHQYEIWNVDDSFNKGHFAFYMDKFMMPEAVAHEMRAWFKYLVQKAEEGLINCM